MDAMGIHVRGSAMLVSVMYVQYQLKQIVTADERIRWYHACSSTMTTSQVN